jgi:hypothetical protein
MYTEALQKNSTQSLFDKLRVYVDRLRVISKLTKEEPIRKQGDIMILLQKYYFGEEFKGVPGGNGGRAGCGGETGFSGKIMLITHQNKINEKKESIKIKNLGPQGERGKVGRGGKNGAKAMIMKGYNIEVCGFGSDSCKNEKSESKYFTVASNTYADSGIESNECSRLEYKPSAPSDPIALYQLETEYLKFTNSLSSKLVQSDLMNRRFLYHIMNETTEVPSLLQLIERTEALARNEALKYAGGNEMLLRKMLVAIESYSAKTGEAQLVANFTRVAVLSAINLHKASQQTNIVVDLQSFLEQSITFSDKLQSVSDEWESLTESLASQVHRKKSIVEYSKSYESRIKQVNEVLFELQKDIEVSHVDMSDNIKNVLAEIEEIKKKNQQNADELNRKKKELQESLKKEQILEIIKLVWNLATVVATAAVAVVAPSATPIVGFASTLVTTGLGFAENAPALSINPGDRQWADDLAFDLERSQQCNKNPTRELSKSERTKRSIQLDMTKTDMTITDMAKIDMTKTDMTIIDMPKIDMTKIDITKIYMTKIETGQITQKTFGDMLNPPLRSALDIYKKDKAGKDKVKLIEEAMANNRADMHNLNRAKDQISCLNGEIIKTMFTNISDMVRNQSDQSGVYLRMSKYKLKRIIDVSKAEMFQLIKHFESKGLVDTTFKRLENAILAINDVYGLSEAYNDKIKLASYIADITKPTVRIPGEYEWQVTSLKKKILADVILYKYEQARRVFGLRSFPFFCVYDERAKASTHSLQTDVKGKLKTLLDLVKDDKVRKHILFD